MSGNKIEWFAFTLILMGLDAARVLVSMFHTILDTNMKTSVSERTATWLSTAWFMHAANMTTNAVSVHALSSSWQARLSGLDGRMCLTKWGVILTCYLPHSVKYVRDKTISSPKQNRHCRKNCRGCERDTINKTAANVNTCQLIGTVPFFIGWTGHGFHTLTYMVKTLISFKK